MQPFANAYFAHVVRTVLNLRPKISRPVHCTVDFAGPAEDRLGRVYHHVQLILQNLSSSTLHNSMTCRLRLYNLKINYYVSKRLICNTQVQSAYYIKNPGDTELELETISQPTLVVPQRAMAWRGLSFIHSFMALFASTFHSRFEENLRTRTGMRTVADRDPEPCRLKCIVATGRAQTIST